MSKGESWSEELHDYQCTKCKRIFDVTFKGRCPKCGDRTMIRRFGQKAIKMAAQREEALDYEAAIQIWESLGEIKEAARVRELRAEMGSVKVSQSVVHGDYIDDRDTIVKDSVVNKSNIGAGGKSKSEELREAKALLDDGIIDDAEFKQMKKEILGK